jgi:hypothetical protein
MAFDSLFVLFREPVVADRTLVDGWIYFGWVAMILLMLKDTKKNLPVVLGFITYGSIFVFAIPSEPLHGWYRYPFYPFLAIATAVFLVDCFNRKYMATALYFLIVGLSMFAESWAKVLGFSYPVYRIYIILIAVGTLPSIFPKIEHYKIFHRINMVLLLCIILLSVWTVFVYNEQ